MDELAHLLIQVRLVPDGPVTWKQMEEVIEAALRGKISADALDATVAGWDEAKNP